MRVSAGAGFKKNLLRVQAKILNFSKNIRALKRFLAAWAEGVAFWNWLQAEVRLPQGAVNIPGGGRSILELVRKLQCGRASTPFPEIFLYGIRGWP